MVSNRIIKIDLNKKTKNVVQMVQGDTNRKLTINVYDSDEPYLVNGVGGETIHGAVYIEKPDGTTCGYDTLEDDSPAVTGSGNTLTVYFVPQATTAHGWAYMTVSVFDDEGVELNTFGIDLFIDKKATATISADYWNLKSIEGLTAAVEGLTQQMVRSVNNATADTNGNVTLLPWQLPYNGVIGGQQVGDVEEALDGLARMQSEIINQEIKDALINALSHVAWTDEHGQDYIDALELAMRTKLVSITAVFNQGSAVIYDTDDLDTLRQYLTVTALYSDNTTKTVTEYTLSGTLSVGTSTITASYGGKTTTFTATCTAGFKYTADRGLLSAQQYITVGGAFDKVTESIENNALRLQYTKNNTWNVRDFVFAPSLFVNDGHLKIKFSTSNMGWAATTNTSSYGQLYFSIANGEKYYTVGMVRYGSTSADVKLRYSNANGEVIWGPTISLNAYHVVELIVTNETATLYFDGSVVSDNVPLGESSSVVGRLRIQDNNSNNFDVSIESIEYSAA